MYYKRRGSLLRLQPRFQGGCPIQSPERMDSCPVNWETLDSLVMDLARSDNLVEDLPSSPSTASSSVSSYNFRLLVRRVRYFLEKGEIDEAINLLRIHAPAVLSDHRLLFRLQKQVIELRIIVFYAQINILF